MTITHERQQITRPLDPMPGQIQALRRLHDAGHLVRPACWQPEMLAWHAGLDLSLAALVGGDVHFNRTVSGELMALFVTRAIRGVPLGLIAAMIQDERTERDEHVYAMPELGPVHVWGACMVRGACIDGVWLEGVGSLLLASLDQLPIHHQQVIRSNTLTPGHGPVDVTLAGLDGWTCVEETADGWQLALELV
jgi:hypothetical protein